MKKNFDKNATLQTPQEVAQQSVQHALDLGKTEKGTGIALSLGEYHDIFSHQVTESLTLKEFAAQGQQATLFMEFPHNRLYTILLDKGYPATDALKLSEHIKEIDSDGHITAKAIIGGTPDSLRGADFHSFESHLPVQTALQHGLKIVYADAARVYPDDFCMDFSDSSTDETARALNARRGTERTMGPDDMLIRNAHMARMVKTELETNGGFGLLATGGDHVFGTSSTAYGLYLYEGSLAMQFQEMGVPSIMVHMLAETSLPADYQSPEVGRAQTHHFYKPGPRTSINDMSDTDIHAFLTEHDLAPDIYDLRNFAEAYRSEFEEILTQAAIDLGVASPSRQEKKNHTAKTVKTSCMP